MHEDQIDFGTREALPSSAWESVPDLIRCGPGRGGFVTPDYTADDSGGIDLLQEDGLVLRGIVGSVNHHSAMSASDSACSAEGVETVALGKGHIVHPDVSREPGPSGSTNHHARHVH